MQITFLGTSASIPTKERNVSGIYLSYKGEGILFDCGEGSQRQMNLAGIRRTSVRKILVSHFHADHMGGIIGLLQTVNNEDESVPIEIFGPKGTKERMDHMLALTVFDAKINLINLKVTELNPKEITRFFENEDYYLECAYLEHSTPCIGFSFVEKEGRRIDMNYLSKIGVPEGEHLQPLQSGKSISYKGKKIDASRATRIVPSRKITYISDTQFCKGAIDLAEEADILITECTYAKKLREKAEKYKHLTAEDAAMIATQANAKKLILTHFSQRYKETSEIEEDAKTIFDNVVCAYDFMKVIL